VQQKIDESFAEKVIPADDSVRLQDKIVERMNLRALWSTYDARGRKPATPADHAEDCTVCVHGKQLRVQRDSQRVSAGHQLHTVKWRYVYIILSKAITFLPLSQAPRGVTFSEIDMRRVKAGSGTYRFLKQ
jgi:hypothetical protein